MDAAEAHLPIAAENMARRAVQMMAQGIMQARDQLSSVDQPYGPHAQNATETAPNTRQGTQSQSAQFTPQMV